MNEEQPQFQDDGPVDSEVSQRLRRLASKPVDTSRVDALVRATMKPSHRNPFADWMALLTPVRAIAASVLVAAVGMLVLMAVVSGPASASTERLAAIYETAVGGSDRSTKVASFEEARAALRRKWPGTPELPELPEHRAMSCCVHAVGRKQMASVTFEVDGAPVTMAMASSNDIKMPHGDSKTIAGREYRVGSASGVNMVMSQRDGMWMCLMGKMQLERLAELSESLRDE